MKQSFVILIAFVLLACVSAEIIENRKCNKGPDSRNIKSTVHEIRVIPCAEADDDEPCKLKKGTNATIEVDFTPTVNANRRIRAGMFWMSKIDMIFRGMKANACSSMPCPIQAGNQYTFSAHIPLGRDLPAGNYPIKLKVYEGRAIIFCQTLRIKLIEEDDTD